MTVSGRKILVSEEAYNDLDSCSEYISRESPRASLRFLREAQAAFELLADMPELGVKRDFNNPELNELRMWPISKFKNYLIFYTFNSLSVEVIRVLHGARNLVELFEPPEK